MAGTNSPSPHQASADHPRRLARRSLLAGGGLGLGLGALLGAGGAWGATSERASRAEAEAPGTDASLESVPSQGIDGHLPGFGGESLPCHGKHQAGIVSVQSAHVQYHSYLLHPETDAAALQRMFRVLTGDIEGLTSGFSPLADPEPELAARPARLSVTVGVGSKIAKLAGREVPEWLAPLPKFSLDELGGGFDGGDLLIVLQADDPTPISHAARMIGRDLASFVVPLWVQRGFTHARGAEADGTTMRNLMGQIDGTVNPSPQVDDFEGLVWLGDGSDWLAGGSAFVLRRIRMELDTWDMVDRPGREASMGRRLSDGSPLSAPAESASEHTPADFEAKNTLGLSSIGMAAHIRRAHSTDPAERIYRRASNYDDGTEAGLLFGCYQTDPHQQFVPIQQRLDEADLMNEWVTHTGSAVFAMLPGFAPGGMLGETLFT